MKFRVRDPEGNVVGLVEAKDAEQAILIAKVNPDAVMPEQEELPLAQYASRNEQAARVAAEEKGNPLAIASGRFVNQIGAGVKQAALTVTGNKDELSKLSEEQEYEDTFWRALQKRYPLETALGEAAPYMALPAGLPTWAAVLATAGTEAAKYGSPSQRARRAAVGGIAMYAGSKIGQAAAHYVNPPLTPTQTQSLREMEAMGVKPRLSEVTQSPFIARMEDFAARVPGGAGRMEAFQQENAKAINEAAARSMGQPTESGQVTAAVFARAQRQLGKVFESIKTLGKVNVAGRSVNPIRIDSRVATAADDVIRTQAKLGDRANTAVLKLAQDAKRMAGLKGRIDGEAYQLWHSELTDASWTAFSAGDSATGKAYQKLLSALDDSADASLRQIGKVELADKLKSTRPLYANFKTLTKGTVAQGGNISPARLAQVLRSQNPDAFRTGKVTDELGQIARYSEAFPPLRAGSPTMERTMMTNPLEVAAYALPANLAARLTTSPATTYIPRTYAGTPEALMAESVITPLGRVGLLVPFQRLMEPQLPKKN